MSLKLLNLSNMIFVHLHVAADMPPQSSTLKIFLARFSERLLKLRSSSISMQSQVFFELIFPICKLFIVESGWFSQYTVLQSFVPKKVALQLLSVVRYERRTSAFTSTHLS